jgi:uncharacterized repeat protein (TIGR03803 family)
LYSFTGTNDGSNPVGGLVQGTDGDFYGTTYGGGTNGANGTVFKITANAVLTSLHSFSGSDGSFPEAGLIQGSDGNFYGTTYYGGMNDWGTVFKITPDGTLTSLYSFTGGDDGGNPQAALVQASDGNLYGSTYDGGADSQGTLFKITTDGTLTTIWSFNYANGSSPYGVLVQGSDGNLYGTAQAGGTNSYGTVFKISTSGTLTTLYSFTGALPESTNGFTPFGGLVQGSDGNFYGTTYYGGPAGFGTVFKITTNGDLTSLYAFGMVTNATGQALDGANPQAALVQGTDGNFYGTTDSGGSSEDGTIFRLSVAPAAPVFQTATLANRTLSLTWSAEPGGVYQLQFNSDLSSGNWTNLGGPATAIAATLSSTDTVTNGPQRFYRVVLLP